MAHSEALGTVFADLGGLDRTQALPIVERALTGADDGELFVENARSESLTLDDGQIRSAAFHHSKGFGLRAVVGERTGYAHASELGADSLRRAADTVRSVTRGASGTVELAPPLANERRYQEDDPIGAVPFEQKVELLSEIDSYARALDARVQQVSATLSGSHQAVGIIRAGGATATDIRPLVRLNVSVVVRDGDRMETGSYGSGGRHGYAVLLDRETWTHHIDEALRQALILLDARAAPAGETNVVLGPGWPGILLHEAIGHGLEGDFNRKKTSVFSSLMGERVANEAITVVDDGTLDGRRGSLTIDDEGTPTQNTTLIEHGRVVGYMQDRQNARLMGTASTGNGRRQSYAHQPMPRMRNTIMMAGQQDPDEIVRSVKNGLYAKSFAGGQVDITNGKFVFSANESYLIEDGKITAPVKGATLIGSGFEVLKKATLIGNDLMLDPGIGSCGKQGQLVPVGVGQPTMLVEGLTVGGTDT